MSPSHIWSDVCASSNTPTSLRLGSEAPNFKAVTTKGEIDFHEFIGDNWVILFSHPVRGMPVFLAFEGSVIC